MALIRLDVASATGWRQWLKNNCQASPGVWLVFRKGRRQPRGGLRYQDALDEALCYGWIDSVVKRVDDEIYLRKFTPRVNTRNWSEANKRHARRLIHDGRMTKAGRRAIGVDLNHPGGPSAARAIVAPSSKSENTPACIRHALRSNARAARFFRELAPGYRKRYVGWIMSAKLAATRARRLDEVIRLLERRVKSVMK